MHFSRGISGGIVLLVGFLQEEFFITKKNDYLNRIRLWYLGQLNWWVEQLPFSEWESRTFIAFLFMMKKRFFY